MIQRHDDVVHCINFSAASLVLLSNRGSMDARYFQVQLCTLVNFLHLVHPEDMSPKSMSA